MEGRESIQMEDIGLIHPKGSFLEPKGPIYIGLHRPNYFVKNLRKNSNYMKLGTTLDGQDITNECNFPDDDVNVDCGEPVFEIKNPFPFYGTTYILKYAADRFKNDPLSFRFKKFFDIKKDEDSIFEDILEGKIVREGNKTIGLHHFPRHVLLSLAVNSKSPKVLQALSEIACDLIQDSHGIPIGLKFVKGDDERPRPSIRDKALFEAVANNPNLPDSYKKVMVLNPGVQGQNPIVGEYINDKTHVWEYLRKNSYIPWGHFASNMAQDAIRYSVNDLTLDDIKGLRFLYYQRIYCQLATSLGITLDEGDFSSDKELEEFRIRLLGIVKKLIESGKDVPFNANLWGWNYGFGYASSGYRLHASHQQIHNQYALVPKRCAEEISTYVVGDLVRDFIRRYETKFKTSFFDAYIKAIRSNSRIDGSSEGPEELIIFEDENVMAFCPKAQRSQGEVQLMAKRAVGNILEADSSMRNSIDKGILLVMKALSRLGAEMITVYEVSKRYDDLNSSQRLFYCFLPRHENSPGSMSEAQGRWITGHYPEDFAWALRTHIENGLTQ